MVENYLAQCVESVINQTCQDFELILVDNASPDNCGRMCEEYAKDNPKVKVIHREINGRPAGARNSGLEIASGDYIIFLDSDDWMTNGALDKLSEIIANEKEKDIYFATHITYFEKTGKSKYSECFYNKQMLDSGNPILILSNLFEKSFSWAVWRHVFRREVLNENNIKFDETVLGSEDGDFFINAVLASKSYSGCDLALCNYRVGRDGSVISTKSNTTIESNLMVAKRWFDYFHNIKNCDIEVESCKILEIKFANMFCSSIAMVATMDHNEWGNAIKLIESGSYIVKYAKGVGHKAIAILYITLGLRRSAFILRNLYWMYKKIKPFG